MMTVWTSDDGHAWINTEHRFKSKAAARKWYDEQFPSHVYDYRVGFLVRTRAGKFYQMRHPNGKTVNP